MKGVKYSEMESVPGNVHVDTAESFFLELERSLDGTYYHVSAQHLHRCVFESGCRYRTRKLDDGQRAALAIA